MDFPGGIAGEDGFSASVNAFELIVKGKRISGPPHYDCEYARAHSSLVAQTERIRSLRASARRSTSVLFSFVLSCDSITTRREP